MLPDNANILALRDANQRFYDAFGSLDLAEMDAVWEQSDRALCVHPGWQPIVGWPDIRRSWQGIFNGAALMHFNIHYVNIAVEGNCGFVTCVESITSVVEGQAQGFGVLATNIFVRSGDDWLVLAHHASPRLWTMRDTLPDPAQLSATDRNLWQAIVSEAVAHLTYSAYARQARAEGLPEVAAVFERIANAETEHGISYLQVAGEVGDTAENLTGVIAGETREYTRTYPRMISEAMAEGRADARAAFTRAMEQEKEHQIAFSDALARLGLPASDGAHIAATLALAAPVPATAEPPALPLDLETYIDAARALDKEPFHVANLGRPPRGRIRRPGRHHQHRRPDYLHRRRRRHDPQPSWWPAFPPLPPG